MKMILETSFSLLALWEIAGTTAANLGQDLEATYWKDGKVDPLAWVTEWPSRAEMSTQTKLPI